MKLPHPRGRKHLMEVVHPLDSESVTLRPCPPWCTEGRHFGDDEAIYADDGYHHYGTEIEVPTSDTFLGMTGAPETIVRVVLKSWTHPLDAEPGPVLIELNLGTAAERTDMYADVTPAEARAVARALLGLADTAEREGPAASGLKPAERSVPIGWTQPAPTVSRTGVT
jgi:hypothetical protein